jgi:hypothetical protein
VIVWVVNSSTIEMKDTIDDKASVEKNLVQHCPSLNRSSYSLTDVFYAHFMSQISLCDRGTHPANRSSSWNKISSKRWVCGIVTFHPATYTSETRPWISISIMQSPELMRTSFYPLSIKTYSTIAQAQVAARRYHQE